MRAHVWVWLISLFLWPIGANAQALPSYWTVDEYVADHPEQASLMEAFAKHVRNPAMPRSGAQSRPLKIAAVYPDKQSSDYWRRSLLSFEKRMSETGIAFETRLFSSSPQDPHSLQAKQLYKAVEWEPDYLIFTLDVLRHKRLIEQILKTGTPKLIVQNVTTPHRAWNERQPFLYVGFDHALGTQKLAQEYIRRTDGQGAYTMLYFTKGLVSRLRGDTFNLEVAKRSDLDLKLSFYTDGDRTRAREYVTTALKRYPNMRNFYACSTDVALGAIDALEEHGLIDEAIVNGWGGGDAELKALKDGKLDFTVMRMNDDNGVAMAEAIQMDFAGQGSNVPTIYSGDIELITDETSQSHIDDLIKHAFRYSGVPE